MPRTHVGRLGAGALISATFAAGLLGLSATAAGACTTSPRCSGPPPLAAVSASASTDAGAVIPVNCPPPTVVPTSSGDKPNC